MANLQLPLKQICLSGLQYQVRSKKMNFEKLLGSLASFQKPQL